MVTINGNANHSTSFLPPIYIYISLIVEYNALRIVKQSIFLHELHLKVSRITFAGNIMSSRKWLTGVGSEMFDDEIRSYKQPAVF